MIYDCIVVLLMFNQMEMIAYMTIVSLYSYLCAKVHGSDDHESLYHILRLGFIIILIVGCVVGSFGLIHIGIL